MTQDDKIRLKVKTIVEIDYREFDKAVNRYMTNEHTGRYEFLEAEEASNDSEYLIDPIVDDESWDKWVEPSVDKWQAGERRHAPAANILLGFMIRQGMLPLGEYLVKVSW